MTRTFNYVLGYKGVSHFQIDVIFLFVQKIETSHNIDS